MVAVNEIKGPVELPGVEHKPSWTRRLKGKVHTMAKSHKAYFACKDCCQKEEANPGSVNFQQRSVRILEAQKNPLKGKAEGNAGGQWDIFDVILCPVRCVLNLITCIVCVILCCPCLAVAGSVLSSVAIKEAKEDW